MGWQILVNTNKQNNLFYDTPPTCPSCQEVDESFEHALTCGSSASCTQRDLALQELNTGVKKINTPEQVIEAIITGTTAESILLQLLLEGYMCQQLGLCRAVTCYSQQHIH
jgi:hypothetical protein